MHGRESADMAKSKKKPVSRSRVAALLVILVLLLFNLLAMPWLTELQIREVDYNTFITMT